MQDAVWDPERVTMVGSILTRYSAHLAPGHRIRMGMEGDPCYRGNPNAPKATVLDVHRDPEGFVRFRAQLDGQRGILELDNRNLSPDRIWEVDPDYLDTFRGVVEQALSLEKEDISSPSPPEEEGAGVVTRDHVEEERGKDSFSALEEDVSYRSTVDNALDTLRERLEALEASERTFRDTMAGTVRELAGDLLRASRGDSLAFAGRYADRYDLALHERVEDSGSHITSSHEFRASSSDRHQQEKYDFRSSKDTEEEEETYKATVTPLQYVEDGHLTD